MAGQQKGQKKGGSKKHGRNLPKCKLYRERNRREKNKLKRVLKSNGYHEAVLYAREHNLSEPQRKK